MSAPIASRRTRGRVYASPEKIKKLIRAARECGIPVGGFELSPDGHVRIFEATASSQGSNETDFDLWEGQL